MIIDTEREWKIEGLEVTAPLDSDMYLSLEPIVNQVASREWRGSKIFEIEDVAQAIWLHMMENWAEYVKAEPGLVNYMATRAARAYCQRQRVDYMYANGAFLYTQKIVRGMLEQTVFCEPEHATDVDGRADINEAMQHLSKVQRAAIFKKFALKEPLVGAEKTAESRGVTNITHRLNSGLRLDVIEIGSLDIGDLEDEETES